MSRRSAISYHGHRRVSFGAIEVQLVPYIDALGDGEHVGTDLVADDLITGEESSVNSDVPVADRRGTVRVTGSPLSVSVAGGGQSAK